MRFAPKLKRFEILVLLLVSASIQILGQAVPARLLRRI